LQVATISTSVGVIVGVVVGLGSFTAVFLPEAKHGAELSFVQVSGDVDLEMDVLVLFIEMVNFILIVLEDHFASVEFLNCCVVLVVLG